MPPTNQNNSNYFRHTHDGVNSPQISGGDLINCPQDALTPAIGGSLSSGGIAALSTADSAILSNAIARIDELETKLRAVGIIL